MGWKGKETLRAYVPKNERIHFLRLIGGDTSKFEKNKFDIKREIQQSKSDKEVKKAEEPQEPASTGTQTTVEASS